jgi:hypothetical protein
MHPEEAQKQSQTPHTFHDSATAGPGAKVQDKAVPFDCGTSRVFILTQSDGDSGQDLVSEQESQRKETERSRNRKDANVIRDATEFHH